MTQDPFYTPGADAYAAPPPKKNKTVMIVIIVLAVLLLCCCLAVVLGGWFYGDTILEFLRYEMGLDLSILL